jgi:hypothetical protein
MEAVSFSETSVSIYQTTRCNIPEDSHYHARHLEDLKSHQATLFAGWLVGLNYQFVNSFKNDLQHFFEHVLPQQEAELLRSFLLFRVSTRISEAFVKWISH